MEVHTCAALAQRHECVTVDDHPHRPEHSIEVQLPFLQRVLADGWTCVPLVVGATTPEQVADVLDTLCVDGDMLPVVSTDLSHYLDQGSAQRRDRHTAQAVVDRDDAAIAQYDACGAHALRVSCTGRAGMISMCGCCAWAPLPTPAETRSGWSATPRSRSSPQRVLGPAASPSMPTTPSRKKSESDPNNRTELSLTDCRSLISREEQSLISKQLLLRSVLAALLFRRCGTFVPMWSERLKLRYDERTDDNGGTSAVLPDHTSHPAEGCGA